MAPKTLKEAKPGETVMITGLFGAHRDDLSRLRDMGAYEGGLLTIDENDEKYVSFHKDSISVSVPADIAEGIQVVNVDYL